MSRPWLSSPPVAPGPHPDAKPKGGTGTPLSLSLGLRGLRGGLLVLVALGLSGCIQYDLGLRFENQTSGAIVQKIALDPTVANFSPSLVQEWFTALDRQAPQIPSLGQRSSPDRYTLTVPFYGSRDLTQKFAQVIPPAPPQDPLPASSPDSPPESFEVSFPASTWRGALPPISAHLSLEQDNRLIALHTHLCLTLDLRPLAALDHQGRSLLGQEHLLQFTFSLATPWGLDWAETTPPAPQRQQGRQVIWSLPVGQVTTIEAAFWLPSPIGLGAIGVLALVLLGIGLRRLRSPQTPPVSPPPPQPIPKQPTPKQPTPD